jgi:hypothetical protein
MHSPKSPSYMTLGAQLKHEVTSQHMQKADYFQRGTNAKRKVENTDVHKRQRSYVGMESPKSQRPYSRRYSIASIDKREDASPKETLRSSRDKGFSFDTRVEPQSVLMSEKPRLRKSPGIHRPPIDQNLSPTNRERSVSADGSGAIVDKYMQDTDEHPQLQQTPRVQAIDLTALQKRENVQKFKFSAIQHQKV